MSNAVNGLEPPSLPPGARQDIQKGPLACAKPLSAFALELILSNNQVACITI